MRASASSPHQPPRTNRLMMKCCSAHKEPASLESAERSFVSSTWRLSKWIRAFVAWKCIHEAPTEEQKLFPTSSGARASLFIVFWFRFFIAVHFDWRQKGPQSNRACLFPACALSRTFDIYHLFTGEKIPALWQTSLDCVCETNVCAPDEIRISSYFRDWRSAENTTGEEEKKRHNRLIFRCAGGEWVDYVLWLFARLRHLAVAWVVDVFPPDFRRLYA